MNIGTIYGFAYRLDDNCVFDFNNFSLKGKKIYYQNDGSDYSCIFYTEQNILDKFQKISDSEPVISDLCKQVEFNPSGYFAAKFDAIPVPVVDDKIIVIPIRLAEYVGIKPYSERESNSKVAPNICMVMQDGKFEIMATKFLNKKINSFNDYLYSSSGIKEEITCDSYRRNNIGFEAINQRNIEAEKHNKKTKKNEEKDF